MSKSKYSFLATVLPEEEQSDTYIIPPTGCLSGHSTTERYQNEENVLHDRNIRNVENAWFEDSYERNLQLKWYQRPSKRVLYLILTLHTLTFTMLMGPLVILMLQNICTLETVPMVHHHGGGGMSMGGKMKRMVMGDNGMGSVSGCKNKNSQSDLSDVQSILSFISGILGFFLSGKYGQLSDRFGRVFIFKIFSMINLAHSICLIIYFQFFKTYHKFWMVILLSVGYFSGGIMTLISNGNSYLNDIVKSEDRTISISVLMSMIYSALGIGPLLGSFIVKRSNNDNMIPLFVSVALATLSSILTFSILKESKHADAINLARQMYNNKTTKKYHTNPIANVLLSSLEVFWSFLRPIKRLWLAREPSGSILPRVSVLTLILIDNFNMAVTVGMMNPLILFSIWKYKWTSVEIGYYMSIGGFGKTFVLLAFAPVFFRFLQTGLGLRIDSRCVDKIDKISLFSSLFFVFLSLLILVCVNSSTGVYISGVLQSLSGMISPVTQSAIAKYSSKTDAGEMFGAIALIRHLGMLLFPILFLQIYSHTIEFSAKFFLYLPLFVSVATFLSSVLGLRSYTQLEELEVPEDGQQQNSNKSSELL
ncbi:uncharacterized protein KLLA0_E24883g [Kluyveromyces lactis]|uniref:KLLA0E24883p n=1 Tax=Kluyveromyces lactis (strain ATCC 8585 / CBS 2359 / DSM 70799 / NBRC 1267 / NRRL Y-1140 / WM37) TaxID=284590 RepID=Q6CLW6_KLULA|nr:uncharacterized protein KLLA0_E24883g [Kluyveromyces lactis]CAH00160.1 KLLA0E24883p [Kluyveromyces lactis]|eukprot:XP_455073.1 uncharacterized protein KLLA0_E24883g [Kluyveromyces lactis]